MAQQAARPPVLSPFPRLSIDTLTEIESDATVSSSDSSAELVDTYVTFTTDVALEMVEGTGLFATFVFEPITDATDDRWPFEDHGLYVDSLFGRYDAGFGALRGGKFGMPFGAAFDEAPGLFGGDFADDYELSERLGFDVQVPLTFLDGEHTIFGSVFTADRTAMSDSIISRRGRLVSDDGGPSNTGSLDSFSVGLAGAFGDIGYNVGFVRQAAGKAGGVREETEVGGVLGLIVPVAFGENTLSFIGEVAYFDGAAGSNEEALYGTFGAAWETGPWTFSAVAASRSRSGDGSDDWLLTAGLDYAITESLTAAAAYRYGDEDGITSHMIGVYLGFAFGFTSND